MIDWTSSGTMGPASYDSACRRETDSADIQLQDIHAGGFHRWLSICGQCIDKIPPADIGQDRQLLRASIYISFFTILRICGMG
jgi:hypothetical protein